MAWFHVAIVGSGLLVIRCNKSTNAKSISLCDQSFVISIIFRTSIKPPKMVAAISNGVIERSCAVDNDNSMRPDSFKE